MVVREALTCRFEPLALGLNGTWERCGICRTAWARTAVSLGLDRPCAPVLFDFATTAEIQDQDGTFVQDRALAALELGMSMGMGMGRRERMRIVCNPPPQAISAHRTQPFADLDRLIPRLPPCVQNET